MARASTGSRRREKPTMTKAKSKIKAETKTKTGGSVSLGGPISKMVGVAALLVLIVVGASLGSWGAQSSGTSPAQSGQTVSLARTVSCLKDTGGASAQIGTVPASTSGFKTTNERTRFDHDNAAGGYAVQSAKGKGWFAARACPTPADNWWFTGVGAAVSHRSILTLDNPRSSDATVTISVYGPKGRVNSPGLSGLIVPATKSLRLDVGKIAPAIGDVTLNVTAQRGLVAASMWESWANTPTSPVVNAWVPATSVPQRRVDLVGLPSSAQNARLIIGNPAMLTAIVTLQVNTASGTFSPTRNKTITVPPESTMLVSIDDTLKLKPGSVNLTSTQPVTATLRTVRGAAEAYLAPGVPLGTASVTGIPPAPATLVLYARAAASVKIDYQNSAGKPLPSKSLNLAGQRAVSIAVPHGAVALRVSGGGSDVAGAMVLDSGGMAAVIGMTPTSNESLVPSVQERNY